jgi:hypothetical protein
MNREILRARRVRAKPGCQVHETARFIEQVLHPPVRGLLRQNRDGEGEWLIVCAKLR